MTQYHDTVNGITYDIDTKAGFLDLQTNVTITDSNGSVIFNKNLPHDSVVVEDKTVFSLLGGGTYVTRPGTTSKIDFAGTFLTGTTYYIGGNTSINVGGSALTSSTINVFGGDATLTGGALGSGFSSNTVNIGYGGKFNTGNTFLSFLSGTTINFTDGGGTLVVNGGSSTIDLSGKTSINNYNPAYDTIEFENQTTVIDRYTIFYNKDGSVTVTLKDENGYTVGSYTANLADGVTLPEGLFYVDQGDNPLKITYDGQNTYIGVCFLAGSMIRTPEGDQAVESIQIGDEVITFDWKSNKDIVSPVVWVGKAHMTVRPDLPDDEAGYPVSVLKNAVAEGVPYKDMLITAEHCLFFENRFVPVRMLVNGVSIFYDKSIMSYDYYHVETEHHSVITADGMLTESYLDTGNRRSFRQNGKIVGLRGAIKNWVEDAAAPLGVDRSFAEPLFHALDERKSEVKTTQKKTKTQDMTNDPDLHLITESGAVIRPIRRMGGQYSFMLPSRTKSVRIMSRVSRPSDVIGPFVDDRRYLGVAVTDLCLLSARSQHALMSHLQVEKPEGWYLTDGSDRIWTNGAALLPVADRLESDKVSLLSITILENNSYFLDNSTKRESVKNSA
ncbi:hypothetical protein AA14337_2709 [Acetobacter malorum DSM 14337]|uniref:Hedgehog/Intein (Hint) domain-containing protein n=1 Tax=Acetobacter malorum DSM 14337 TaxID=1307910 RepID=A0ABQ0PXA8_9PROT|nr:Hint domain-containing protein [Acetobacter malorum]KXV05208.1 hypothetical protein AD930_13840 [Acetobacter malorum]GBQ83906.1 hypothetical protein AA14337_2709 [Acetobacter malorum DSM 14337]